MGNDLASLLPADTGLVGRQFGPYRVLSLLGHGGMGSVWLAERTDGLFTRTVALKLVHPALVGRVMTERFGREREILASLNHPNIARLFDAGLSQDGQPYLALEYIAGMPLTVYCDERRLPLRERLELFRQVLSAVQYAHAHLVIHRDLKPSNILVSDDGQAHLLDFGIAKLLTEGQAKETELTRMGGRALTPDYASPEQIVGAPITIAADIYSLGVMLYELTTGERPYRLKRDTRGALEEAILQSDPIPPSRNIVSDAAAQTRTTTARKLPRALKGDIDTIIMKAMKKAPIERYATANAFAEDIARYLSGDAVLAQGDSFTYRALKFSRRHRLAIAAAGILVLSLAGGLAATAYEARIAATQRDAALQAQSHSLTQTAAARLGTDSTNAMGIILEVLPGKELRPAYTPEALSVFQEARAADAQIMAITGHTGSVWDAAFSPDGRRIVTASGDRTARIWDAATGQQLQEFKGFSNPVATAEFSPDGSRLVMATMQKTAQVWDIASGKQIMTLEGHSAGIRLAAFSTDGKQIVTASGDKTARLWDAATGHEITRFNGHTDRVTSAAISRDGQHVVTASGDATARIWNAATGRELVQLKGHTGFVQTAAFSPDGTRVVTASVDHSARIWDTASGRQLLLLRHPDFVLSATYSPDGRRIVTTSVDKTTRIWNSETGEEIKRLGGHGDIVQTAVFSPDGTRIVTASMDRTARVWDAVPAGQINLLRGHSGEVQGATFSPDGTRIVTASMDRTARIWDAATGRQVMLLAGHTDWASSAAFSSDGTRVITGSNDTTARVWEVATGRQELVLSGHTQLVENAEFSPDGRHIVTASPDSTARIWDAARGRQIMELNGKIDHLRSASYSPDGRFVVTASIDKNARIWDAATGRQVMLLSGHTDWVNSAHFSPDGTQVATASNDKTARIWDAATGRQLMLLGHADVVWTAAFSRDGKQIVTASNDNMVRVWDAGSGQQTKLLMGHTDSVEQAEFSPDGARIVTASNDGTAAIWDARTPALERQLQWAAAAQFDPLREADRVRLGLPRPAGMRRWPSQASTCDESSAAPYDPDRLAAGFMLDQMVAEIAIAACAGPAGGPPLDARSLYQRGRAELAGGDAASARRDFERAMTSGYRAARIELGMLLLAQSTAKADVPQGIALYEQAWHDGVNLAAFKLGSLYEHGVKRDDNHAVLLAPDDSRAWSWYQKAADAAEPNALARFAERAEAVSFSATAAGNGDAGLLEAFKYYAAAANRAQSEDWPDGAWRNWRYRRASLARLLARAGKMQEVAELYRGVGEQYAPTSPTLWSRLTTHASTSHP